MKITESRLRRIIRNVIAETHSVYDEEETHRDHEEEEEMQQAYNAVELKISALEDVLQKRKTGKPTPEELTKIKKLLDEIYPLLDVLGDDYSKIDDALWADERSDYLSGISIYKPGERS